jgi:tRNA dimethylallyltransferase
MPDTAPLPVICLAGPTGTGKTALALVLAENLNGEIVNADSRQVYADFPIITAQPTAEERARCPHHCYAFLPTAHKISAGRWAEIACETIRAIRSRGKTPLLVGGTGLYFQTLLRGIAKIPHPPLSVSREIEARLADRGLPELYRELSQVDAVYAARIHPNDKQRILRALEIFYATKRSFSWWHAHTETTPAVRGPLVVLRTDLQTLAPRLKHRIEQMVADGAFAETRRALAACPDTAAPGWSCIGATEALACLQGRVNREECMRLWLKNTRAYAKRQLTWFRAQPESCFIQSGDTRSALALIRAFNFNAISK